MVPRKSRQSKNQHGQIEDPAEGKRAKRILTLRACPRYPDPDSEVEKGLSRPPVAMKIGVSVVAAFLIFTTVLNYVHRQRLFEVEQLSKEFMDNLVLGNYDSLDAHTEVIDSLKNDATQFGKINAYEIEDVYAQVFGNPGICSCKIFRQNQSSRIELKWYGKRVLEVKFRPIVK